MPEDQFRRAYDRHGRDVFRAAYGVLGDVALAEEVTQEVFLALWRGGAYDAARGPLGSYLRMLARARAVDAWRRRSAADRATTRLLQQLPGAPALEDEPHVALTRRERRDQALAAVRALPGEQRAAIALTYWGGLSTQEAAERLGIPLGTAKSRVRLALRKLAGDPELDRAA